MNAVAKFFASGFGTGYSPVAPGTAGSLLASAALFGLNHVGVDVNPISLVIATVITTIAGVIATNAVEDEWGKDPSKVVIDEIAGIFVSLLFLPITPMTIIASFILFRIFDIWKPLGIRKLEELKGGVGVMADDLLAGIYANLTLQLMLFFNLFG
jgi:phosphatidylglycerophosphatase A